jgi:hypothetical protein
MLLVVRRLSSAGCSFSSRLEDLLRINAGLALLCVGAGATVEIVRIVTSGEGGTTGESVRSHSSTDSHSSSHTSSSSLTNMLQQQCRGNNTCCSFTLLALVACLLLLLMQAGVIMKRHHRAAGPHYERLGPVPENFSIDASSCVKRFCQKKRVAITGLEQKHHHQS